MHIIKAKKSTIKSSLTKHSCIDMNNCNLYEMLLCCRLMFWINGVDGKPLIERADMDGRNRQTVVSTELISPSDLALDVHMGHRLYWSDPKKHVIESVAVDGSDRVIAIKKGLYFSAGN